MTFNTLLPQIWAGCQLGRRRTLGARRLFGGGVVKINFGIEIASHAESADWHFAENRPCAVPSGLGACGMQREIGAGRRRRRGWVQGHFSPAVIQAICRRRRRWAAPARREVARIAVLRAPERSQTGALRRTGACQLASPHAWPAREACALAAPCNTQARLFNRPFSSAQMFEVVDVPERV